MKEQILLFKNKYAHTYRGFCMRFWKRKYADILFHDAFGRSIDWKNPRDLNEVINYLAFKGDHSVWPVLADKYAVRNYVQEKVGSDILIPIYGHWNRAELIDFDCLPQSFVLKPNNGSGDVVIVRNKGTQPKEPIIAYLNDSMKARFGYETNEPHYLRIKPQIVAEKLLQNSDGSPIVDYKVWCINGVPCYIFTCSNRNSITHTADFAIFDLEWERKDEFLMPAYRNNTYVKKPEHLEYMLECANKLAGGLPQVRIDFYEVDGKVYFGEMTLTSMAGRMPYFTPDFLVQIGSMVQI